MLLFLLVLLLLPVFGVRADDGGQLMVTGDTGEEVVRIQTRLFDLGYYTYKSTGSFRTVTKSAVVSYQASSGLMSDGSVGQETLQTLFSRYAKRVDFHAAIPLTFTAQGAIAQKGSPVSWKTLRPMLTEGTSYRFKNASTGEEITLIFDSGEQHAEMTVPTQYAERNTALSMLSKWLGKTNSFYKCAALMELDGQWIAASMQWNGENHVCVYFKDSLTHVLGFPDAEHDANIKKASY